MFSIWAHDDRLFHHWLTSSSTTFGFDAFAAHAETWRNPEFRGTSASFRDLEITISASGDVADSGAGGSAALRLDSTLDGP